MTVKEIFFLDTVHPGRPNNYKELARSNLMTEGVLFNCSARIEKAENGDIAPKGNCTEQGLIRYLMDVGVDAFNLIQEKTDKILDVITFSSGRKRACTALKHPEDENLVRVFVKGAPEIVLGLC